jgi:peptide chain release factor 1
MKNNIILDKLSGVNKRFEVVGKLLIDPTVLADMDRYIKLNKEYKILNQ